MKNKGYAALVIIFGFLFTFFIVFLIPVNFGQIFKGNLLLNGVFIAIPIVLAVVFVIVLTYYVNRVSLLKTIELENENVLGRKSEFNNLYVFQKRVFILARFRKKQPQHVIAFTFSTLAVSQNVNRNEEVFEVNSFIVDYLPQLAKDLQMSPRDFVFGYSSGTFLVYTFKQNEQSISLICETIAKKIYDFGAENCRHVWIQPFFGIQVVNDEETLVQHVDNAQIARQYFTINQNSIWWIEDSFLVKLLFVGKALNTVS